MPEHAPWETVTWLWAINDGPNLYVENRGDLLTPWPSTPWLVNHPWIYEEDNGLPGLQRGGVGILGDWFPPGCDQTFDPLNLRTWNNYPCVTIDSDPISDEDCGHGADHLIF